LPIRGGRPGPSSNFPALSAANAALEIVAHAAKHKITQGSTKILYSAGASISY